MLPVGTERNETILTPTNVNSADFGKLFSIPVDGQIYAQPVYMSDLSIPGQGTHNVVFVVTENDSVYAFDSDTGGLIWHDSLINPSAGVTAVQSTSLIGDYQISPEIGISSTPVIDPTTNTIYVVAYTQQVSGSTTSYAYTLHALDVTTGAEKFGGPVVIQAEDNGTGVGNDGNGHIIFDAQIQDQRNSLLLLNGVVYFGFAAWGGGVTDQPLSRLVARLQRPDLAADGRLRRHSQWLPGRHLDGHRGAVYGRHLHLH